MKVRKKLGTLVDYDSSKVFQVVLNAIEDARAAEGKKFDQRYDTVIASHVTDAVDDEVSSTDDWIDHRELQDIIYKCLIDAYEVIAAREYLHYSDKKNNRHSDAEDLEKAISKVINKDHDTIHENGNKDARKLAAQRDLIASQVFRTMGLKMYPEDIQEAHKEGLLHLHDLDMGPLLPYTNCCNVNLKDMLDNGFKMDEAYVETPKSIGVAASITSQIIEAVSLSQLGGTSVPDIDMVLSPYAEKNYYKHLQDAKDFDIGDKEGYAWKLTKRDIYQAMQGLEFSINSMHSNGAQVPFVTLSFGRGLDKYSKEIQKAMLNVRIKGLGHGVSAVFPKLVMTIDKGINLTPEDPNYDVKKLALYCSARRDYPDIVFGKNIKEITGGSYMTSMGCRSFLPAWKNKITNEYQIAGRLNLGVVTLNTVRVALDSDTLDDFWKLLAKRAELVHRALQFKIQVVAKEKPEEAPILYMEGAIDRLQTDDDLMEKVFKGGRCTVSFGYIGLYETATKFFGPTWESNPEAVKFTKNVAQYIHDKCAEWYKEEDIYYSEYSTPSETLTGRFNELNRKVYGNVPDITDKDYLNNSFHYDIRKPVTPFEKMAFEAPYQHIATGGFISYVEFPEVKNNLKALETVWDYCYDVGIGYFGTNVPMDTCLNCGFQGKCLETAKGYKCPNCGETHKLQIIERLCGYLGSLNERDISKGRMAEIEHRVYHNLSKVGVTAPEDIHVMPREQ